MKKTLIYLACVIVFTCIATSCQKILNDCKNCKKVYYTNGTTFDHEDPESQYCGTDLIAIEATGPVTYGSYTVRWECH